MIRHFWLSCALVLALVSPAVSAEPGAVSPTGSSGASQSDAIEIEYWRSIENSRIAADYESYLRQYPNGHFADLARSRIAELNGARNAVPASGQSVAPAAGTSPATVQTAPPVAGPNAPAVGMSAAPVQNATASPFNGRWLVQAKEALGDNVVSSVWELTVVGGNVRVKGAWGPMTFESAHAKGNTITLDWSGMWVGGAGGTFEGKLVNPHRIEGRWHLGLLFSSNWWAEKL